MIDHTHAYLYLPAAYQITIYFFKATSLLNMHGHSFSETYFIFEREKTRLHTTLIG